MESEGLKASALRPRHFAALGNIEEAFAALQAVIDRVRIDLATRGWKPIDKPTALQETYWEALYRPASPASTTPRRTPAQLMWGVEEAEVFAGIYFERNAGGEVRPRADDEWRVALTAVDTDGWEEDDDERDVIWVGRSLRLVDLLGAGSVETQGDELADFVHDAFTRIVAARPRS